MKQPLEGVKILVTRPESQADSLIDLLRKKGALPIAFPLIRLQEVEDKKLINKALEDLYETDWIIFTSANAVNFFFDAAEAHQVKFHFLGQLRIATVGEKTKLTLEQRGYRSNFVPIKYTAAVLAEQMEDLEGKRILIPRSGKATNEYLRIFREKGADIEAVTFYENIEVKHELADFIKVMQEQPVIITFTSGSAVRGFSKLLQAADLALASKIVCIGPSTAMVAEEEGLPVTTVANLHTIEGMVEAMERLYA